MNENSASAVDSPKKKSDSAETRSGMDSAMLSFVIWLVFLAFGGGLLSMYYARIGYFPDITWEESLSYLAVLSMLGCTVVIIYSLCLIVPGLIWSEGLVHDEVLKKMLCLGGSKNKFDQPCSLTIFQRLVAPFAVFMLGVHIVLFIENWWWRFSLIGFLLLLTVAYFYYQVAIRVCCSRDGAICIEGGSEIWRNCTSDAVGRPNKEVKHALKSTKCRKDCRSTWFKYALIYGLSLAIGCFSLLLITEIAYPSNLQRASEEGSSRSNERSAPAHVGSKDQVQQEEDDKNRMLMLLICTVSISLANMFFVLLRKRSRKMAYCTVFIIAVLLLVSGEIISDKAAFSFRLMKQFGFGADTEYSLVVTDDARKSLLKMRLPMICFNSSGKVAECWLKACPDKAGDVAAAPTKTGEPDCTQFDGAMIDDIQVLSRLGSQYILQQDRRRISLPKEWVLSWLSKPEQGDSNRQVDCGWGRDRA